MLGVDKPARKLGSLAYRRVSSNTLDWYMVAANYIVPVKSCLILDRHSTDTCSTLEQHSINLANNMLIDSQLRCRPIHWSTHDLKALPSKLSPWWTPNKNSSIPDYPPPEKIASQYLQGLICRGRYSVTVKVGNGIKVQVTQWYEPYGNIKGHSGPPCWKAWKNEWYKKRLLLFIGIMSWIKCVADITF